MSTTTKEDMMTTTNETAILVCPVKHEGFGPHGGEQYHSPRYFFCGCDAGYCERHTKGSLGLGRSFKRGTPKKCRKHTVQAEA